MAATYPQQIAEAAQWLQDPSHGNLKGDALAQALEPLPWEPSVKSLAAFPQIIQLMNEHIEWTEALGVAFATQQGEVMARVQALRHLAMKSGKLKQVKHLTVREQGPAIIITSAEPDRVYVPVYNPTVVYGAWPDREFPPVYLSPPQGFVAETIEPGFEVSAGYGIVRPLWGWSEPDWRSDRVTVNPVEYTRITRGLELAPGNVWRHSGPVVMVSPSGVSRTTTATTNAPAGTVAPASAAAVTALPQRAAAQPNVIRPQSSTQPGEKTTTAPMPTPSNQTTGNTTQPAASQRGQTTTSTTSQPSTAQPGKTTTTAQPTTTQPGKLKARLAGNKKPCAMPWWSMPSKSPSFAITLPVLSITTISSS